MNRIPRASAASLPLELLKLLRPHQWVKSGFVFVGLLFGGASGGLKLGGSVLLAAAGFCLVSSCVYVLNDIFDRKADQAHPRKRRRPLARGTVSMGQGLALASFCGVAGLALGALASSMVAGILLAYLALNLVYSAGLKNIVILDVFIIAAGFMLRIFAGTWGVNIAPSHWLLLCGLLLTIFLGFAKRRAELMVSDRVSDRPSERAGASDGARAEARVDAKPEASKGSGATGATGASQRPVLYDYSPALLDTMMAISAAGVVVGYSLYTVSPDTIALHHTDKLIYTLPFVLYGIFRYILLLHRRSGEDLAWTLLTDAHLLVVGALWLVVTLGLIRWA